jgi:hypothetical protein
VWQFRCIPGYEWNFSITLYEFLLGFSAIISAIAIILSGIRWLNKKLDKNETIINSCQPYINLGRRQDCRIKSQHEFTQILREAPLELLQKSSLFFIISFSSKNNNEYKILYKSTCKQRLGLFWTLKTESKKLNETLLTKINRVKANIFGSKQYEDYIIKNIDNATINTHKLDCEIILDPVFFIPFNKNISTSIKIQNSDKSQTPWYEFSLKIDKLVHNEIDKKLKDNIGDKELDKWLEEWRENMKKNNEDKFDLDNRL